jgi:hypothetical protein
VKKQSPKLRCIDCQHFYSADFLLDAICTRTHRRCLSERFGNKGNGQAKFCGPPARNFQTVRVERAA